MAELHPIITSPSRRASPMPAPIPTIPHRTVRFQLDDPAQHWRSPSEPESPPPWVTYDDEEQQDSRYDDNDSQYDEDDDDGDDGHGGGGRDSRGTRAPLLTGITAPSVQVAMDVSTEELLEGERPKSGLGMAFFNMSGYYTFQELRWGEEEVG